MSSHFPTAKVVANVHRFGRFYLASVLTGLLGALLVLSAQRENSAAPLPRNYAALGSARPAPLSAPQPQGSLRSRRGR